MVCLQELHQQAYFISATAMTTCTQNLYKTTNGSCILLCIYFLTFPHLGCCLVSTLDPLRISRYPLWMNLSLALFPITHATNFLLLVLPLNQSPECYETTSFCSFPAQTFFLQSTAFTSCVFVVLLWDFPLSKWPAHCKENGETVSFDSLDMT